MNGTKSDRPHLIKNAQLNEPICQSQSARKATDFCIQQTNDAITEKGGQGKGKRSEQGRDNGEQTNENAEAENQLKRRCWVGRVLAQCFKTLVRVSSSRANMETSVKPRKVNVFKRERAFASKMVELKKG